jgi:hypothetical protein
VSRRPVRLNHRNSDLACIARWRRRLTALAALRRQRSTSAGFVRLGDVLDLVVADDAQPRCVGVVFLGLLGPLVCFLGVVARSARLITQSLVQWHLCALPAVQPTNPRPPRAGSEMRCYRNPLDRLGKKHWRANEMVTDLST